MARTLDSIEEKRKALVWTMYLRGTICEHEREQLLKTDWPRTPGIECKFCYPPTKSK